jgi:hypothetical protein
MGERRDPYRIFLRKPEGKRPLERTRHRYEDTIEKDHQEVGCGDMDWIGLAQDRDGWRKVVCALMKYRFSYNSGTFLPSRGTVSISGRTVLHGVGELVMYFVEQIVM